MSYKSYRCVCFSSHNGRVKMGDWNFLGGILEEVHIHSTMVGKIWLTLLFVFRMLVLGVAAEDVWNDEQADFVCNTEQPGCRNACYDLAFPISLIRYWVLQVIFVSSPSLVYMGHALYRLRALEKARRRRKAALRKELEEVDAEWVESRKRIEREMKQLEQGKPNKAPLRGSLLCTYVAHVVTRSVVEVAFMLGQYLLYGFRLHPLFKCQRYPCPNAVDCYVSRPTEKSVFMVFMQCIAAMSLFLNILEVLYLGYKRIRRDILDFYPHLWDERDDLEFYRSKKASVVQVGHRKATLVSAPGDFVFMETRRGSRFYPTQPSAGCQGASKQDDSTMAPTDVNKEDLRSQDKETSSGRSSPQKASSSYTFQTVRRPWGPHDAPLRCATVLEGRSSDTDSCGCEEGTPLGLQSWQSTSGLAENSKRNPRAASSSGRRASEASVVSSRQARDLQI
ncbi:gap junction protein alpha 9a [Dunckerocampus dactyliophorus]|uniref:gap junction protein alpha 9a n=1 Tax=Dunckerocampus dactyliophorus TaxID=161453 RepID=UPI0024068B24|nr:gap junction protein alpha 9a [Dunckerocampus dactyliophorus]